MSVDSVLADIEDRMTKAVSVTKEDFSGVRTGRAAPALVERLRVDYYGADTALQQLASISVPDHRTLLVNVYDQNAVSSVEKAIRNSDLGLNPSTDGSTVRLTFPPLSAERRKEMVKLVKAKAEEHRVSVRNLRHRAKKDLEHLQGEGEISEDDLHRSEKRLQDLTNKYVGEIDELLRHKEHELLED
ncbi:MAG: ribosome recycling factor [Acidimicrobiia bacterium]